MVTTLDTRRGFLASALAAAGVAVAGCATGSGPSASASRTSTATFRIPEVGNFPTYVKDSNVGRYVGDKVEGGTLAAQRNTVLIKDYVKSNTNVSAAGQSIRIRPVAQSGYATAFEARVGGQDYIVVQNDNSKGPDGSDFRCDAVIFPICDNNQPLPSANEINRAQAAVEQAVSGLSGKNFYLVSYEANHGELSQCRRDQTEDKDDRNEPDRPVEPKTDPSGGCSDCGSDRETPTGPGGSGSGNGGNNPPGAGRNGGAGASADPATSAEPSAPSAPSAPTTAPSTPIRAGAGAGAGPGGPSGPAGPRGPGQ